MLTAGMDKPDVDGMDSSKDSSPSQPPHQLRIASVQLKIVGETLGILQDFGKKLELSCTTEQAVIVSFHDGSKKVFDVKVKDTTHVYQAGSTLVFLRVPQGSAVITLQTLNATNQLINYLFTHLSPSHKKLKKQSVFNLRTEDASAKQYFQFYGYLSQQQNMMQDYIRTATYQSAMLQNTADFKDKVVLDVGAGTGILSFFAVQAGARKVYSIEASSMAVHCLELVKGNRYSDRVIVIAGKVEEVDIPEEVDLIVSEPMGYMLYNERMLESFLHAKKWLKPGGKMYPSQGILFCAPFTDDALYMEQLGKANFWFQQNFHGVDVSSLRAAAVEEYLRQPVLDTFDVRTLLAKPVGHTTDFTKAEERDLYKIVIPLSFKLWTTGTIHGLAFWFDVAFIGSQATVWLSTAPFQPLTHWYQIRCLLRNPIFARSGQELAGIVQLTANERQSYDIVIEVCIAGTNIRSVNSYDLKNPNFRYVNLPPPPPGSFHHCPTENYWEQQQPPPAPAPAQLTSPTHPHPQIITSGTTHNPRHASFIPAGANDSSFPGAVVNGGVLSPKSQLSSPFSSLQANIPIMHTGYVHPSIQNVPSSASMINLGAGTHHSQFVMGNPGGGTSHPLVYQKMQPPVVQPVMLQGHTHS